MKYGFVNVAAAVPTVKVADVEYNIQQIEGLIAQAEEHGVEIIVFPELCITGYSCQDLFKEQLLLDHAEEGVVKLLDFTRKLNTIVIVGLPVVVNGLLYNCAAVLQSGTLLGIVPKVYLPNYGEFYEKRWFASSQDLNPTDIYFAGSPVHVSAEPQVFVTRDGVKFGVEICEDVWAPTPPSNNLALAGADIIFNLSASDELIGKHAYLKSLLSQQSARMISGYVYSSCGFGESTQDVVYGGNAIIFENGRLLEEGDRFSLQPQLKMCQIDIEALHVERRTNTTFINAQRGAQAREIVCKQTAQKAFQLTRNIDPYPFIPKSENMHDSCEEILNIQVMGLVKRLYHINGKKAVIGISGGLDSTLALLVAVKAFDKLGLDRKGIVGITMPGFGTTDRTYNNALKLMETLGVTIREISIAKAVTQHFADIQHDAAIHDITYENSQARERTQILMDVANQENAIVVGTGDLSELALGWATYNGDHMSMYGVNAGVPKTLIRYLVSYVAGEGLRVGERSSGMMATEILNDIVDTPISPELIPADEQGNIKQKTEDLVGPYELHDFFIYYFLRYGFSPKKIFLLAKRAFCTPSEHKAALYDEETVKKWLTTFCRRFFNQQFKRSCLPDGPKVGSISLSPRGDWRMPSDASSALWLKECESLYVNND
jgi:NAD+ synthase (glutamine-hydrolysing)